MAIIIRKTAQTLLASKEKLIASNAIKIKEAGSMLRRTAGVK